MRTEELRPAPGAGAAADTGKDNPAAVRSGERLAVALNRVRRQVELLCADFVEADKPLYLDELAAVRRQLEAVQGRLQHGEFAGGDPPEQADAVARVMAVDDTIHALLLALEREVIATRTSKTPVRDSLALQARTAELQAAVARRFAAAGA